MGSSSSSSIDSSTDSSVDVLPDVSGQVERLIDRGVAARAGFTVQEFRDRGAALASSPPGSVVVVHPDAVPASVLATLLRRGGKSGFVVADMVDLDDFRPIDEVRIPAGPLYTVTGVERGDELCNWSPAEALSEILGRGRRPLTVNEGISWLLQQPDRLQPNHCFMTIASRKREGSMREGSMLDRRAPAIWISGGTGRDGRVNRGAPKVGWCWEGNRHTWLGFASADGWAADD